MATQQALRFLSPGVMSLVDIEPPAAGPGDALVAPRFVGICGTDRDLLAGVQAYIRLGDTAFPIQPGHEWSGVVVRSSRLDMPAGTPVMGDPIVGCGACEDCFTGPATHCRHRLEQGVRGDLAGAAATLIAFPEGNLHRVPDGLALEHAVLAEPAVTAMEAVARLGDAAGPGGRILVVGAGTLGLIAAGVLVSRGCDVTVAVHSRTGLERAERLGARPHGLRQGSPATRAFDGAIEASGGDGALSMAVEALRAGATLALLGVAPAPVTAFDSVRLITDDLTLTGVLNGPGRYDAALAALAAGQIRAADLVDEVFPLADAEAAFERISERSRPRPKVLLAVPADGAMSGEKAEVTKGAAHGDVRRPF